MGKRDNSIILRFRQRVAYSQATLAAGSVSGVVFLAMVKTVTAWFVSEAEQCCVGMFKYVPIRKPPNKINEGCFFLDLTDQLFIHHILGSNRDGGVAIWKDCIGAVSYLFCG